MKLEEEKSWQEQEPEEGGERWNSYLPGWLVFGEKKFGRRSRIKISIFYKVFVFSRVFIEFKIEEKFRELIQDKKSFP